MIRSPRALFAVLLLAPATIGADDPATFTWRGDYAAARQEAERSNKPILINVGSANCFHCRRMDETTFRDPAVAAMMARDLVPVKIDGNRDMDLTRALKVTAYPTVVVAAPDGRVLGYVEGYVDAAKFRETVARYAESGSHDWMARDYAEAQKLLARHEFGPAMGLLRPILKDDKDRPIQSKARAALREIQELAFGRLTRARDLERQQRVEEARDLLADLSRRYPGTPAAEEGAKILISLEKEPADPALRKVRRAEELLAQAHEEYDAGRYGFCLELCDRIEGGFPNAPLGIDAAKLAVQIRSDPKKMGKVLTTMQERSAAVYWQAAEALEAKGDVAQAALWWEKLGQVFPESEQGKAALVKFRKFADKK